MKLEIKEENYEDVHHISLSKSNKSIYIQDNGNSIAVIDSDGTMRYPSGEKSEFFTWKR